MEKVRKVHHNNREILIIDYSDARGNDLIAVFESAKGLVLSEGKSVLILNILNNKTYLTPGFMRHIEKEIPKVDFMIEKQAIIGLSKIQEWILKGMNLWYKTQIYKFNTVDEALDFLTTNTPK